MSHPALSAKQGGSRYNCCDSWVRPLQHVDTKEALHGWTLLSSPVLVIQFGLLLHAGWFSQTAAASYRPSQRWFPRPTVAQLVRRLPFAHRQIFVFSASLKQRIRWLTFLASVQVMVAPRGPSWATVLAVGPLPWPSSDAEGATWLEHMLLVMLGSDSCKRYEIDFDEQLTQPCGCSYTDWCEALACPNERTGYWFCFWGTRPNASFLLLPWRLEASGVHCRLFIDVVRAASLKVHRLRLDWTQSNQLLWNRILWLWLRLLIMWLQAGITSRTSHKHIHSSLLI